MKAIDAKLLGFLKNSPQFVIPIYQRTYSWKEEECLQLWNDILRTGKNDKISAHFIGSIVYVQQSIYQVSVQSPLLVIDGQQRLTTISLLIEALSRGIGETEPFEDFSNKKLRNYYLLNPMEKEERYYKLILSQTDKDTLIAIMDGHELPKNFSIRVVENFKLFQGLVDKEKNDLPAICKGLAKLMIVDISLTRDQDNPQLIFESLNSTGRELSQADLIRNYILMGLEPEIQDKIYAQYWRPMEQDFGQEAYADYFDRFIRDYLTLKTGEIPNIRKVYDAFKQYAPLSTTTSVESLVADIRTFAGHFCAIALGTETDTALKEVFHDLRELKVEVAYPLLLELYHDYKGGNLTKDELLKATRLVESYVFRRSVCGIPTNSLNKTFTTFTRRLKKDRYLESIQATFLLLESYRRFPDDDEYIREFQNRNLYNFRNRIYWLRRMENHGRKERVSVDEYTIEHIMPQNEEMPKAWRVELGEDWKRIHKTYLHTLGNLTLTGYNAELSDRSFIEKRDMKGGFSESPLRMNKELKSVQNWTEEEIQKRAELLAKKASEVWGIPKLETSILDAYKQKTLVATTSYTIDDHPNIASGTMQPVFEAFRKQVIALDPCVTEEFLKLYVAYKAETNFVDVVPQAKRLRLSLNMKFHELNDPKGLCKDVSGLGRWGNGDVEVGLSSLEEIPYIMGLVRQSFDKQMGNESDS